MYIGLTSAYMEGLAQISARVLSEFENVIFNQLTFTVPRLLQFIDTSETLSFSTIQLTSAVIPTS
jgi:hypothetical protein